MLESGLRAILDGLRPETLERAKYVIDHFADIKAWDDYLSARNYSDQTRRTYRYWLLRFISETLLPVALVREDDVVAYVAALPPKGESRAAVLKALKSFYTWAAEKEMCGNPTKRLKIPRRKAGPAPFLTEEELCRLVYAAACREERRAWAILFAYTTGGRASSLCAVRPEDVKGSYVYFREAKGNKPYRVPLSRVGKAAVEGLKHAPLPCRAPVNKRGTLLGVGPTRLHQWISEAGAAAEIHAWPHLMRHQYATQVARVTDPRTWQELMNHSDLSQFRRYVAPSSQIAAVEAAFDGEER